MPVLLVPPLVLAPVLLLQVGSWENRKTWLSRIFAEDAKTPQSPLK
jgi:hypothetical protein